MFLGQVPSPNYITISNGILIYIIINYAYKTHIGSNHGATTPRRSIVINQLMQCSL